MKKQKTKKGLWKFLSSVFVLAVIWQLIFFQCLAPLFYLRALAEDETGSEVTVSDSSGDSEDEEDPDKDGGEKNGENNEESDDKEDAASNSENGRDTSSEDETSSNETTETNTETQSSNESNEDEKKTANNPPAETIEKNTDINTDADAGAGNNTDINTEINSETGAPPPATESTITASAEILSEEETDEKIDLKDNDLENNNQNCLCPEEPEENPPVISEDCLTICQTVKIENANEAAVENSASSDSQTGGNIVGENNSQPADVSSSEEIKDEKASENEGENGNKDEGETGNESELASESETVCESAECPPGAIDTGGAVAVSNIINDVNSNEVGNNFDDLVVNITGEENGEINLYEKFVELLENAGELTEEQKTAFTALLIENINKAQVTNNASASAESGGNGINGAGDASIKTGDAAALANIINLINRNLVGNNWLFSMINVLGIWNGDLIVPGEGLLSAPQPSQAFQVEINNENNSDVSNNAKTKAETGNNGIEDASQALIATGEAQSANLVTDIINTNVVKNNWFFLLVNNMGRWVGNIFNWDGDKLSGIFQFDFGIINPSPEIPSGGILKVHNVNDAVVENNASAYANTGANYISNAGNAAIKTGNASALTRIFNFINANIVGSNWMFSIVNIMGEWNGNLEFAYPDLAVSISDGRDNAQTGETLVYNITVKNNGKANCENISVAVSLDENVNYQSNGGENSPVESGGSYVWNVQELKRGEEKNFKIMAKISEKLAPGDYMLQSAAGVTTKTKEVKLSDNTSSDFTGVAVPFPTLVFENDFENDFDSHLSIKREMEGSGAIRPGEYVKHIFYIENKGDTALYDVILKDVMKDENGADLTIYQWEIGVMQKGQKIMVDYTLQANNIGRPATFIYEAQAYGEDPNEDEVESRKVESLLTILGFVNSAQAFETPSPEIAGAEAASLPEAVQSAAQSSLPLWIFLAALAAYYLAINWSLVQKKVSHKK